jgi:hypothetical protein
MLKGIGRRFTSAHAIALLALFVALGGSAYAVSSINGALLKRGSVPGSKLKKSAVTSAKLAGNAVTSAKIAGGAVRAADLGAGAVGTANLADGAVANGKLAGGAVTNGKLGDGAVTGAKLAGDSVDGSKVADGSIGGVDLTPSGFSAATLQNGWTSTTAVGFAEDVAGYVHLRGAVLNGTLGTVAFQLPAGQRPAQIGQFGALHIFGGTSTACVVTVATTGDVKIGLLGTDTGCTGTAGTYSLDGITFRAG